MVRTLIVDDTELEKLEGRIQVSLGGRVRYLRLHLHEDGIVLRGRARTYYAKQLAQHAVMQLCQIPLIANRIEVQ